MKSTGTRPLPRKQPGAVLHRLYQRGLSIYEIMALYEVSYHRARDLLIQDNCQMRPCERRKVAPATPGMIAAYADNLSLREVATMWGITYNATRNALLRARVELRPPGTGFDIPTAEVYARHQLRAQREWNSGWIDALIPSVSRFTPEQITEMVTDRNNRGMTYRAIAAKHDTKASYVYELIGDQSTAPLTYDMKPIPRSQVMEMAEQYESGLTIRQVCQQYKYSYGKVYRHLAPLVEFRPRGRPRK